MVHFYLLSYLKIGSFLRQSGMGKGTFSHIQFGMLSIAYDLSTLSLLC
jgi:hypothetical protein